jgi:hypothetical protein
MYRCAQDAVEYLLSSVGGGAQDSEHRAVRQAIFRAYDEINAARQWKWHITESSITVQSGVTDYLLPANVTALDSLIPEGKMAITQYITPYEWKQLNVSSLALGQPLFWTVMQDPDPANYGRYLLRVAGEPIEGQVLYFTYQRRPRALRYTGYEPLSHVGVVSASGTAVTGVGTAFVPDFAGAVIRFGTSANTPEAIEGMHPYREQILIASVESQTALTMESATTLPTSTVKYAVTDVLDMSPNMFRAFLSCCESWYARLQGKPVDGAIAVYQRDLRLAFEQDVIAPISGQRGASGLGSYGAGPRYFGWASPSMPNTGG